MTVSEVQSKAAKMEHDKTVDTLIRRFMNEDHDLEKNEFDVRKNTVIWGLKRAANESLLL